MGDEDKKENGAEQKGEEQDAEKEGADEIQEAAETEEKLELTDADIDELLRDLPEPDEEADAGAAKDVVSLEDHKRALEEQETRLRKDLTTAREDKREAMAEGDRDEIAEANKEVKRLEGMIQGIIDERKEEKVAAAQAKQKADHDAAVETVFDLCEKTAEILDAKLGDGKQTLSELVGRRMISVNDLFNELEGMYGRKKSGGDIVTFARKNIAKVAERAIKSIKPGALASLRKSVGPSKKDSASEHAEKGSGSDSETKGRAGAPSDTGVRRGTKESEKTRLGTQRERRTAFAEIAKLSEAKLREAGVLDESSDPDADPRSK